MGLGAYRTAWKRQTKFFGHDHGKTYASLVFDNRGMGLSDKPTCRYSTSEMAKDIVDLLGQIGWLDTASTSPSKRNLHIIGVSMGGMIAQELSLLIPQSTASLILVSTFSRMVRTIPFVENLRQRINMFVPRDIDTQLHEIGERLFSDEFLALPDTEHSATDPALNYPTNWDRFAANELKKRADTQGFTRKGFMLQAIAAGWHVKTKAQLLDIKHKVGADRIAVVHGTIDRMITFKHFEIIREEMGEGPTYRVWNGKGHVLMWEEEDEFNAFIKEFVDRRSGEK